MIMAAPHTVNQYLLTLHFQARIAGNDLQPSRRPILKADFARPNQLGFPKGLENLMSVVELPDYSCFFA
jgi:hypothetical protein